MANLMPRKENNMSKDQNQNQNPFAFGFTREQWTTLYDKIDWVTLVRDACIEVAGCEDARTVDRAEALHHLGDLVASDLIPDKLPNGLRLPEFVVKVHLSAVTGVRVWSDSTRESCAERIRGVRELKNTIGQILVVPTKPLKVEQLPQELQEILDEQIENIFGGKAPQGAN